MNIANYFARGRLIRYASLRPNSMVLFSSSASQSSAGYFAVHVQGRITPNSMEEFHPATMKNAMHSVLERGVSRFDFLRKIDNADEFMLIEVYKTDSAPVEHKETRHYLEWRDFVAPMMAEPRSATKFTTLYPPAPLWDTPAAAGLNGDVSRLRNHAELHPWSLEPLTCGDHDGSKTAATGGLLAVMVHIHVKPGNEDDFISHTLQNCRNSLKEPGVHRYCRTFSSSNGCCSLNPKL